MKIKQIIELINGQIHTKEEQSRLEQEVFKAFACDLMSDCLAFVNENCVLITGLTNTQSLRTAEMLDIDFIIVVRGKAPGEEMIQLAIENNVLLVSTTFTLYETSGILYSHGIQALKI